ncbi:kinase-like domain-containing protein [Xylaria digitata]|nr:kinase-like domain-containing protein [Xylaria digitata]
MACLKAQSDPSRGSSASANHIQETLQLNEDHVQPDDEPTQMNTEPTQLNTQHTQLNTDPTQLNEKPALLCQEPLQLDPPSRLGASRLGTQAAAALDWNKLNVPPLLNRLRDARIVFYPRTRGVYISPYGGTEPLNNWAKVDMEDHPPARVLIVAPNTEQIGCTVVHNDATCHLFFDPANDPIIFDNASSHPFFVTRRGAGIEWQVPASDTFNLRVGIWSVATRGRLLMEVRVLERMEWSNISRLSTKRATSTDENSAKKIKLSDLRTAVRPRPTPSAGALKTVSSDNALAQLEKGMSIRIGSHENGYWLTHLGTIYENQSTVVWRAQHSGFPGGDIVVKIIKAVGSNGECIIRATKHWQREMTIHSSLPSHRTIVPLINSDARFLSLYTEYIDAKPLSDHTHPDSSFNGSIADAYKIIRDMAAALSVAHAQQIVHGDIKPANILYSSSRGAVTIDFGLSFLSDDPPRSGGTPWYLAPEYAEGWNLRQPASDIWALGVVMLWVLGRICLPERSSKSWQIADIHPEGPPTAANVMALDAMKEWIRYIRKVRSGLRKDDGLEGIISKTLQTGVDNRIDAASLCERISRMRITTSKGNTGDN